MSSKIKKTIKSSKKQNSNINITNVYDDHGKNFDEIMKENLSLHLTSLSYANLCERNISKQ
jgi:hypothetical protein